MNARQPRTRPRGRLARLAIAAGAALALASCGGGGHAGTTTSHDPSAAAAADPADGATGVTGAARVSAVGATGGSSASPPATPDAAQSAADVTAADPVHPALSRLSVTGGPLTLVVDQSGGPFAQQNQLIREGVTAALDVLNAHGGVAHHTVRVVTESLDGLSGSALEQRLHAAGSNAVLVLPCDNNSQAPLATAASRYGVVMLAPCDADASLAERLRTYWPVGMSGSDEASGLVHFLVREGFGRVFVVNSTGLQYTSTMTAYMSAALKTAGIPVVGSSTVSSNLSNADVANVLAAVRVIQPASLFTALPPPQVDKLVAGLVKGGEQQVFVFGTSAMDTPATLSSPGNASLQGATFPTYGFARVNGEATAFEQDFKQRFGQQPIGAFPGLGFETVGLLEQAIAKARSTQPAAIQRALLGGINDGGVALFGRSYHNPNNHNPVTTVSIEKVNADAFLPLVTTEPDGSPPPLP